MLKTAFVDRKKLILLNKKNSKLRLDHFQSAVTYYYGEIALK